MSDISVPDTQLQLSILGLSPFTTYSVAVSAQLNSGTLSAVISDTAVTLQDGESSSCQFLNQSNE